MIPDHLGSMSTASPFPDRPTKRDFQWAEHLNRVKEYHGRHGALPKETGRNAGDDSMAKWLVVQRKRNTDGTLMAWRMEMLNAVLPDWADNLDDEWLRRFEQIRAFRKEHRRLPGVLKANGHDRRLYDWLIWQRRALSAGTLQPRRRRLLNRHLPGWAGAQTVPKHRPWMENFEQTLDYYNAHGAIPTSAKGVSPERERMSAWLNGQRAKARKGGLSPERKQLLDDAFPGWAMTRKERDAIKWNRQLADVAAFKAKHGVIPRDDKLEANEHALRVWLARQRKLHAEGKLPADRLEALNAVDADWLANGTSLIWENNFASAVLHLGAAVSDTEDTDRAHRWLDVQRSRIALLSEDQLQALDDAIPGWRRSHLDSWQKRLKQAAADLTAGKLSPADEKWLNGNRSRWLRGKFSEEKARMLDEAVPGWRTTTAGRRSWDAALRRAAENHAAGSLTREDARWLINQRIAHSRGKLASDKVSSLDANIPAWDAVKAGTWIWLVSLNSAAANLAVGDLSAGDRNWLRVQRSRRGTAYLSFEKALALDLNIPSWRSADLLERENMERAAA